MKDSKILGVRIPTGDKTLLKEVAQANRLTMSDVARLILLDGLTHMNERNILRH